MTGLREVADAHRLYNAKVARSARKAIAILEALPPHPRILALMCKRCAGTGLVSLESVLGKGRFTCAPGSTAPCPKCRAW